MSARELQRTAIRMLHDPTFLAAVMRNPEVALSGLDLNDAERAMLAKTDARAWAVDGHRSWRVLTALLSEFAVTVAATREAPHALDAFFGTPHFHEAIRARRSLSAGFADYLASRHTDRRITAMLALEAAFARVRRGVRAVAVAVPEGALTAWEAAAALLRREDPVAALMRGARPRITLGRGVEHVLVEAAGAALIDKALYDVLVLAETGATHEQLLASIESGGATSEEAEEVLADLIRDGLVAPSPKLSAAQR